MSDQDDFNELLEEIKKVEDPLEPTMPVEVMAKEAQVLFSWFQDDKKKAGEINFDLTLADSLLKRAAAMRWAETMWIGMRTKQADAQKELVKVRQEAIDLRNECLSAMEYAFKGNEDLLNSIKPVRGGSSDANMSMDHSIIARLGSENKPLLDAINFEYEKITQAAEMAGKIGRLMGEAGAENLLGAEEKTIRDKAFTYCKTAVDEVRKCGKYINRNNESRLKGYTSEYTRQVSRKHRRNEKQKEAEVQVNA